MSEGMLPERRREDDARLTVEIAKQTLSVVVSVTDPHDAPRQIAKVASLAYGVGYFSLFTLIDALCEECGGKVGEEHRSRVEEIKAVCRRKDG